MILLALCLWRPCLLAGHLKIPQCFQISPGRQVDACKTIKVTVDCKMMLCTLYMSVCVGSNDVCWCQPQLPEEEIGSRNRESGVVERPCRDGPTSARGPTLPPRRSEPAPRLDWTGRVWPVQICTDVPIILWIHTMLSTWLFCRLILHSAVSHHVMQDGSELES